MSSTSTITTTTTMTVLNAAANICAQSIKLRAISPPPAPHLTSPASQEPAVIAPNGTTEFSLPPARRSYPQLMSHAAHTAPPSPTPSRCSRASLDSVSLCLPHLEQCWKHRTPTNQMPRRCYDFAARIILLGDYNVGKTSILRSLSRAKDETGTACCCEFRPGELVTAIFKRDRKQSLVKVMDTGGQEKYRSMTSSYYRGIQGCLLVFDVTREDTFYNIMSWYQDVENYSGEQFVASILVGTTSHPGHRVISAERAFKMAESLDMIYLETDTDDDVMTIAIVQRLLDIIIRDGLRRSSSSVIIVPPTAQLSSKSSSSCSC